MKALVKKQEIEGFTYDENYPIRDPINDEVQESIHVELCIPKKRWGGSKKYIKITLKLP